MKKFYGIRTLSKQDLKGEHIYGYTAESLWILTKETHYFNNEPSEDDSAYVVQFLRTSNIADTNIVKLKSNEIFEDYDDCKSYASQLNTELRKSRDEKYLIEHPYADAKELSRMKKRLDMYENEVNREQEEADNYVNNVLNS